MAILHLYVLACCLCSGFSRFGLLKLMKAMFYIERLLSDVTPDIEYSKVKVI